MLDDIRNELTTRHYTQMTTLVDWQDWATQYELLTDSEQNCLEKLLAEHTGLPKPTVKQCVDARYQNDPNFISKINESEQAGIAKIAGFCARKFFKDNSAHIEHLAINRSEWLSLIHKFELSKRHSINMVYFLTHLSTLRRVSYSSLLSLLERPAYPRDAKAKSPIVASELPAKRKHVGFFKEEDLNPLIVANTASPEILSALEFTGVRVTALNSATPEKGYSNLMSTASGKKVRPLCDVKGICLFKPVTPFGKSSERARADLRNSSSEMVMADLPRLNPKKAEAVEFTATLEKIIEREGKRRRQSQNAIMGASARHVFEAHGIEVSYEHKNEHHWAHLIGHFLCDSSEVSGEADEVINLIPSTAAANYNTLKVIELFIKGTLKSEKTEEIHIHVLPRFSGDALIPDQLIYTLKWMDKELGLQTNVYYINPQSYARITSSMQNSIEVLNRLAFDSPSSEDDDESFDTFVPTNLFGL